MTSKKQAPILYDQRIEYIDPIDHQSAVGYIIKKNRWGGFDAEVELMGCDRKIHWQFDGKTKADCKQALQKIDKAIGMLQFFRDSYITSFDRFHRDKRSR
jgi:hypothetical protein